MASSWWSIVIVKTVHLTKVGANICSWVCKPYSSTLVGNCIQLDLELLGGHRVIVCNQEIIRLIEWLEVKH